MTTFPVAIRPPDSLRFEREKLIGRLLPRISSWPAARRRFTGRTYDRTVIPCSTRERSCSPGRSTPVDTFQPYTAGGWNRSGPIAPVSNGLIKIPSGLPRRSRSRLVLRMESGKARISSPPIASTSNAQSCSSPLCLPECNALKSEMPSTPRMTASPSMMNCFVLFFSAASTIQGKRLAQSWPPS